MEGANVLQTVFDTIMYILNIIKDFFNQLFPKQEEEETTAPAEEA